MAKKNGKTAAEKARDRSKKKTVAKGKRYMKAGERKSSRAETQYARAGRGVTQKGSKKASRASLKGEGAAQLHAAGKKAVESGGQGKLKPRKKYKITPRSEAVARGVTKKKTLGRKTTKRPSKPRR
jgi:hypothetical protein